MSECLFIFFGFFVVLGIIYIDLKMNIKAWKDSKKLKELSERSTKELYK